MSEAVLLIGTKKGLWIGRSDAERRKWTVDGPQFEMQGIYSVGIDTRGARPRLFAGGTSEHWGPSVFHSDDLGKTWDEPPRARSASPRRPTHRWSASGRSSRHRPTSRASSRPGASRPHCGGPTTGERRSSWSTACGTTRTARTGAPGFGGQAIHTVLPHPTDPARMSVAMSTGGVYRTSDGGDSWEPANHGIKAHFMPDPDPEFGQCVHKLAGHPAVPERMFAQNHHGVYRSDDGGTIWKSIADGLPSDFGFPIVVHPHEPDTVYIFPLVADANRIPADGKCHVYRSRDAGSTWEALTNGLPEVPSYAPVLRDAMCVDQADPAGVYFGTRDGCVYASADEGDTWTEVARHLPDVLTVRAAVL